MSKNRFPTCKFILRSNHLEGLEGQLNCYLSTCHENNVILNEDKILGVILVLIQQEKSLFVALLADRI